MSDTTQGDASTLRPKVLDVVQRFAGPAFPIAEFDDATAIVASGICCDSVRVVELLMACEDEFQIRLPAQGITTDELTIGALVEMVSAAVAAKGG